MDKKWNSITLVSLVRQLLIFLFYINTLSYFFPKRTSLDYED